MSIRGGRSSLDVDRENTGSKKTISLIRAWLKGCTGLHGACKFGWNPQWKPTRLLELDYSGSPPNVRLQTQFPSGNLCYMTLSHRWGPSNSQRLMLTQGTVDTLRERVPIKTLPQTFREAVKLTRQLGQRYIWIDCLCI